jgi:hypothetical protein
MGRSFGVATSLWGAGASSVGGPASAGVATPSSGVKGVGSPTGDLPLGGENGWWSAGLS